MSIFRRRPREAPYIKTGRGVTHNHPRVYILQFPAVTSSDEIVAVITNIESLKES